MLILNNIFLLLALCQAPCQASVRMCSLSPLHDMFGTSMHLAPFGTDGYVR